MDIVEVLGQVRELLQREGRVTYRILKRQFALDDDALEDLKEQLIYAKREAVDEDGRVLVWTGEEQASGPDTPAAAASPPPAQPRAGDAERRQLTVEFIDLVGSTALSSQLDPEELRDLVRAYQETCATVIRQYDGHIAQYLGDGLLVYFGYPQAHEDDAARAIRTGLGIIDALATSNTELPQPLQVRIGIHTGLVVVGEMGGGGRHEQLALGETPNIAARVQSQADPNSVVISAATARLVPGLFAWQFIGGQDLKGVSTPLELYHIQGESTAQSRFEVALEAGLTPLVGREHELQVLRERWTLAQAGHGQAVLVSGEPGIGKSRLVQELKTQVTQAGATQIEFRCSPYHKNSALYPIIEHLQRLLQFAPDDTPKAKIAKLQQMLGHYRFPQPNTLALMASLLSLPYPEGVAPLTVSPQKQKEMTYAALVAWLVEETEQQPVYNAWEDLHWADPSTLEVLDLLLSQMPTTRLLAVLTFRPEFVPSWGAHSYLSQVTLNRLGHPQVSAMVERVTGSKALPDEVVEQIVTKTDGVPLFVEELTKMVVESDLVRAVNSHYELTGPLPPLAIPSTLQDSLMARLDRLAAVREVAQLGATIGREFSYDLLHAVSPLGETALQQGLQQLVAAELIYQRGLPPQARYTFKHALIQDTAYESLLKSMRQQLHQQIALVLEQRFMETVETHPELVAHHYTEAGLTEQALPYWLQAGKRAAQRSAHAEAIHHLTTGLALLETLPETPERIQTELSLQVALGVPLVATKGYAASEVGAVFIRARELCRQLDDSPELFRVLQGLWAFYVVRAEFRPTQEIGEELQRLAHRLGETSLMLEATVRKGLLLSALGQLIPARAALEQAITLYDSQKHRSHALLYGQDPQVASLCYATWVLWLLGYPEQAAQRNQEALTLAQELGYPLVVAYGLLYVALFYHLCRDARATQAQAEALMTLSSEQGFAYRLAQGRILQGWALAKQGQEVIKQMQQNLAAVQAAGAQIFRPSFLAMLAEVHGRAGQTEEGLAVVSEALADVNTTGERFFEAELYRLKGELLLQQSGDNCPEAEDSFSKALDVARKREAKSLELRATTSVARLWQRQGKKSEARDLLAPVYEWFTEGFDTKDLQEAKALLDSLA